MSQLENTMAALKELHKGVESLPQTAEVPISASVSMVVASATLAVAEEQRTANLIEYTKQFGWDDRIGDANLKSVIRERLGITARATTAFPWSPE